MESYTYMKGPHGLGCEFRAHNPVKSSGFDRYVRGRVHRGTTTSPLQDRSSSRASVRSFVVLSTSELGYMSWSKSKTVTRSLGICLGNRWMVLAIGVSVLKTGLFSADDFGRVLSWCWTAWSVSSHPSAPRPPGGPMWTSTAILPGGTALELRMERRAVEFPDPFPRYLQTSNPSSTV